MATIDLPHGTLHLGPDGCARAAASDAHVQASAVTLPGAYGWLTNHQPPHELIDGWISTYLVDRDVRRDTRRLIAALGDDAFMGQIAAEVAGFTKPVLLVWAADDKFFPLEHARRLAGIIPNARLELIEGSRTG